MEEDTHSKFIKIIRGISGTGKSTLAHKLAEENSVEYTTVVETDMWFERYTGWEFNSSELKNAHMWCQLTVEKAMREGNSVIVANTFCKKWEFSRYIELAFKYDMSYMVIKCVGEFDNIHNVPLKILEQQKRKWEDFPNEIIYDGGNNSL